MLLTRILTCGHKIEDAIPANRRNRATASHEEFSMLDLTSPPHSGQAVRKGVEDSYQWATPLYAIFRSDRMLIVCPQHGHCFKNAGKNSVRMSIGVNM
jgi:hypothetical protein